MCPLPEIMILPDETVDLSEFLFDLSVDTDKPIKPELLPQDLRTLSVNLVHQQLKTSEVQGVSIPDDFVLPIGIKIDRQIQKNSVVWTRHSL